MAMVKFVKSVKYNGTRHEAHTPFEVKDSDVALLQKQGAILLSFTGEESKKASAPIKVAVFETTESKDKAEESDKLKGELMDYTVDELIKFAKERNIDLKKKTRKADIYNIIIASL